jgi:hypothetical protein
MVTRRYTILYPSLYYYTEWFAKHPPAHFFSFDTAQSFEVWLKKCSCSVLKAVVSKFLRFPQVPIYRSRSVPRRVVFELFNSVYIWNKDNRSTIMESKHTNGSSIIGTSKLQDPDITSILYFCKTYTFL